jgi:undecaprenyl-phosphate galactose phosphotransferase
LCVIGAFVTGLWFSGWRANIGDDPQGTAGLIILGIITVSFFPTFSLYSYHVIFTKKQHINSLIKSFFWSALTLGIVLVLFNSSDLLQRNYYYFLLTLVLVTLGVIILSRFFGAHLIDFLLSFGLAIFFVGVIGIVYQSGIPFFMTKEYMILGCFILAVLFVACERFFLFHIVFKRWFRRHFRRQVVVIGSNNEAEQIVGYVLEKDSPYFIVGTIKASDLGSRHQLINGKQQLGVIDDLPQIIEKYGIDDIIITGSEIDKPQLVDILDYCTTAQANAWLSPQLMPIIDIKLNIDRFCGFPMILLCSQKRSWLFDRLNLLIDKLLALVALVLLSPVMLMIAVAVKIDSPGPVFYRTEVIGLNGILFKMFKFRSMQVDSEHTIHKDYVSKLINGDINKETVEDKPLKITDDPRVTRVGCFLRKSSLDELPQLFNVLQGNMNLVGPRPCLPYEFALYKEWYKKRTIVQPGITGLWQITGRSEVIFEDMILLDFYYIFNRSIMLDFNIMFETIFVVLGRKGGY